MADHQFTRCPGCGTVFRITAAQLALREGQVRCGHCRAVFDANDHLVSLDEPPRDGIDVPDELAMGRPTITLRSAESLQPAPAAVPPPQPSPVTAEATPDAPAAASPAPIAEEAPEEASAEEGKPEPPAAPEPIDVAAEAACAPGPIDVQALDRAGRFELKPRKRIRERPKALYGGAIALLLLAIAVQALLEYRDAFAAHAPFTRPVLERVCELFGCALGPLRDTAALSIDASDLQADPAHRGLLQLSATIRNRASYAIAYPYLELTLTDSSDRVVVRRAFAPADYIGGTANASAGIPGNGEKLVKLFIDASATAQAGYRVYLFYP
jgi:predicted Zn finger-like uncharacterized protein